MVKGVFKGGTLCHVKGANLGHRWRPYAPKAPTVHDELHIFAKSVYMRVETYLRGNIVCSWALGPVRSRHRHEVKAPFASKAP